MFAPSVMNQGTATDTVVGTATIPLGDLIQSTSPNGLEFMAVQLQRPSGRVQGLVNFSVEIADRSQKYWRPSSSSSSSSKSKGPGYTVDQSIRQNVNLRADSVVKVGSSLDSLALNDPRGRLFGGKEPLAAPDALGSGHIADCRPEPIRQQHRSMETFLGHDKCAVDLLGPSQRSNSIGSLVLRSLVMPPVAASTGTAGNVAPDALDRCKPKPVFQQQDKNVTLVNSIHCPSRDRGADDQLVMYDNNPAQSSFAHTMFGGVLGALLMGDAVTDSKSTIDHGADHGQDEPGGTSSGLPQC
ncbi:hypothetical protein AXG93_3158s1120 [Marchantia polymorpha subsp. ruderalis]|uniref:Uncharacterized protein n=1 Tax=Marchantia polymorpha subsp. ruderalis TaxID=1480154 RepID=A0A176VM11_MARPO|nr:hypothetical protein AXG93_3158s1120 [Marchantia polymorpha subsp. ruderalis]